MIESFDPIVGPNPKVLILGSMPSVKSLEKFQYYGHPRNQFWPIMASLFNKAFEHPSFGQAYDLKIDMVKEAGLVIWDVLQSCEREGSLDSNIKNEIPNPLEVFLETYPSLKTIVFNGGKAEASFKKHFRTIYKSSQYTFIKMPSTSPAYTMRFEEKLAKWEKMLEYLG